MTGWAVTEWAAAIATVLTAGGLVWTKVVKPVRAAWRAVKAWMERVETSVAWTEAQMKPNGGSSLVDRVNQGARERKAMAADMAEIKKMLEDRE